jgi:hypothetical protein
MWANIAAGTVLVAITVLVHSVGLFTLSRLLRAVVGRFRPHRTLPGTMMVTTGTVIGLFAIHTVEIWIWALAFLLLGALPNFYDALFFSTLSYSTLGAEEISVTPEWRLFGSIEGVNGFLLIGWSTAYLIPAWTRHGPFHEENSRF